MMAVKYQDVFSGFFLLIVSVAMFLATFSFKALTESQVGPDFMPKIIASMMMILSIIIIVNGLKRAKIEKESTGAYQTAEEEGTKSASEDEKKNLLPVMITLGLMIGYFVLIPILGFLIMTALYLFLQMLLLSHKSNRKIWLFAILSIATSTLIYYVFRSVFYVMLPTGIIG